MARVAQNQRSPRRLRRALAGVLALALACAVATFSLRRWERVGDVQAGFLSVPPARLVELSAGGFDNLLADAFYLRFTTYWGYWLVHGRKFHNLYPLLELITHLDPDLHPAYEVGALALADSGDTAAAVRLLDQGAAGHPGDYWYPYQAGMMLFLYSDHYALAAHYFGLAAADPNAHPAAAYFQARMYNQAHRRTDAIDEWIHIYYSGNRAMAIVATKSLATLYHIDARWLDWLRSDNPLARRLAGRALLRAGADLSYVERQLAGIR